jgi:hypothetical protein
MKENLERCTRPFVLIVAANVKFHSSPIPADPSIAESAGQREETPEAEEDIRLEIDPAEPTSIAV